MDIKMPNEVVNNNLLEAFNLHLKNEFQPALNIYSSILKIEPENIYANHFLGILLIQNGYFDQGLGYVNKSINAEHSFASESEYNLKLFWSIFVVIKKTYRTNRSLKVLSVLEKINEFNKFN
jgi:tetratricopeptide (TPR) repeat protein